MNHPSFRQKIAVLHDWGGLVAGWLLFAVFLTGTLSYFRQEISLWMRPELPAASASVDAAHLYAARAAEKMAARLNDIAPDAARWLIIPPDDRNPTGSVAAWRDRGGGPRFVRETLDAEGRPVTARATMGGDFFYYFHFDLHMPSLWGRLLVGVATAALLAALVSGVIIHRRIFTDFFTLRLNKAPPRAWLDAHNLAAVTALPYHFMIGYSGLVTMMVLYLPWGIDAAYRGDRAAYFAEAAIARAIPPPAGPAATAPLGPLLNEAARRWDGVPPGRIEILRPNDRAALIEISPHESAGLAYLSPKMVFGGASGDIVSTADGLGLAGQTRAVLYGLHLARFADWPLRWLFALSGAAGTLMIASGLLLWTAKRRPAAGQAWRPGVRFAEGLNVATLVGLPAACAALLWANRLLPIGLAERAAAEGLAFFAIWAAAGLHAAGSHAAGRPPAAAWREQCAAAAFLLIFLPLLNALTSAHGLTATLGAGDWARAGVDLAALVCGLGFAGLAVFFSRRRGAAPALQEKPLC